MACTLAYKASLITWQDHFSLKIRLKYNELRELALCCSAEDCAQGSTLLVSHNLDPWFLFVCLFR